MEENRNNWQEIRQQAQGDILSYMSLIKPSTIFGPQHHVFKDIADDLIARRKRFICISVPPRHGKSFFFSQTLPSFWLGNNPTDQIIATSYAASLAQTFGKSVRADMSSPLFSEIFSPDAQPSGTGKSGTDFNTIAGGKYKATGVGGSLTGFGGNLIVVDDPTKNAEQADSPVYQNMLEKFFGETLYTRLMPDGVILVVATRWRENDIIGHIMRNFSDFEYINIPALAEHGDLLGRSVGDALWPEFFPAAELGRTRGILREAAFQALYQGNPAPTEGGTLSASSLRWANRVPDNAEVVRTFWSWDLAITANKKSNWTVGTYWAQTKGTADNPGKLYMLDYIRMKGNFVEVCSEIMTRYLSRPAGLEGQLISVEPTIILEQSHIGIAVRDQLVKDWLAANHKTKLAIELANPVGDKLDRLQRCLPEWRDGNIWLATFNDRPDYEDCIDELVKAGLTATDDFMDSVTQAVLWSKARLLLLGQGGFSSQGRLQGNKLVTSVKRRRYKWA